MDDRFKKMETDPRFRSIKKKRQKVEVDDRFKEMFTGDKFKSEYRIDKRGKPIHETTEQNLKKFYRLKEDKKKKKKKKPTKKANEQLEKSEEIVEKDEVSEETPAALETVENEVEVESAPEDDVTGQDDDDDESSNSEESSSSEEEDADIARGYGNVESSDFSDDDEMYDDETPAQVFDHNWNELDKEAPRDENISKRMALCNMDWDRIKAEDIFMLFHSFKPKQAAGIKKVSIFISEFGKERLKEEELKGPKEISESNPKDLEDVDEKEGEKFHVENLRQYQINRLKYYYAVIECDCNETANEIYIDCDGMEFETSASKLDLRFIPDEMEFDDEPTQVCTEMPDKDLYQPTRFTTTALNQSKVDLTWDETDKRRVTVMTRRFKEEELEEMDLKEFLASSSEEEESEEEEVEEVARSRPLACCSRTSTADQIDRYRAIILGEMDEEEKKDDDDDDVHMEFTWNPDDLEDKKSSAATADSDDDEEEGGDKEEEFFADSEDNSSEESDDSESEKPKKKKKVKFAAGVEKEEEESEESKKEKAQLAMLMMDDQGEGEQKHFNMNKIIKSFNEKNKKKKRKNKKKQTDEDDEDNFQINLNDDRFSSVFTSSEYAIDPNAPAFKKTPAMMQVVEERRKRRVESTAAGEKKTKSTTATTNIVLDDSRVSSVSSQQKTNNLVSMIKKSTKATQQPKTQKSSLADNPFISGILKKPTAPEKNEDDEMTSMQSKAETKSVQEVENKTKKGKKKNARTIVADFVASVRAEQATKRALEANPGATGVTKKKSKKN